MTENVIDINEAKEKEELKRQSETLVQTAERVLKSTPKILKKFTLDGICLLKQVDRNVEEIESKIKEYPEISLTPQEEDMMHVIFTAISDIKSNPKLKDRSIPLTRKEILEPHFRGGMTDMGFDKSVLRSLEKKKLLESEIIKLVKYEMKDKKIVAKPTGARNVVFFTERGRSYVRRKFDPDYVADFERR